MLVVEEDDIEQAIVLLIEIEKTVAEGAGAAALAALLQQRALFAGRRSASRSRGGNIDSRVLASVLMRGLVRDGAARAPARDDARRFRQPRQGRAVIAEAGGNIVEVQHQRIFGTASVRSPEVEFLVETRDREHTEALVRALEAKGHQGFCFLSSGMRERELHAQEIRIVAGPCAEAKARGEAKHGAVAGAHQAMQHRQTGAARMIE